MRYPTTFADNDGDAADIENQNQTVSELLSMLSASGEDVANNANGNSNARRNDEDESQNR